MVFYYKKKIPSIDDIVIGRIDSINEYGVEVSLSEYGYIKGFINCSEISRKKKINMNKLLTIGKEVLLIVIQVDKEKEIIDLSKRSINEEEITIFHEKNKQHIQLYNIFKHIFMKLNNIDKHENIDQDKLYDFMCYTIWEIQNNFENSYILENIVNKNTNTEILETGDYENKLYTLEQIKFVLNEYIDTKLNRVKPSITENIKLLSYNIDGLNDIKFILNLKELEIYNELLNDFNIKICYISSSVYSIELNQKEFNNIGLYTIDSAIKIIKTEIKNRAESKKIQFQINL